MAELVEPSSTDPQEIVENRYHTYLPPGFEGPPTADEDIVSQERMEEFLWDRLRPDDQPSPGGVVTVITGEEEYRTRFPRHVETKYYLGNNNDRGDHWRKAIAIALGVNMLLNLANGNAASAVKDTVEAAQQVKDDVEDWLGIGKTTTARRVPHREPTTETRIERDNLEFNSSGESQPVGEAVVDQEIVDKILDSIEGRHASGHTLLDASFSGVASDDWRRDPVRNGFGHANSGADGQSENVGLAEERLYLTREALIDQAAARGIDLSGANFAAQEEVLDEESVLAVENAVMANGFDTYDTVDEAVDAALAIYNSDPQSLPESLRDVLHDRLPRGFRAELTYESTREVPGEDKIVYTTETTSGPDGDPENRDHDYDLALLPFILVPLPVFRREMRRRLRTEDIVVPPHLPDPEYLRLYPAARTEEDTLIDEAWAYARKYQHMMRETDRIQGMYRLDFVDADGEPQCLRAMFVDHEPTPDMLERVVGLLQTISQMQGGRVGKELSMIAVYPSDNAGTAHGNPKQVGLGQDIQFGNNILGVAYPSLGLVEMHMPPDATMADMGGHNSPDWVLAHEVAGHFTDLNEEDNQLHPTGVRLANGAEVFLTNGRFEGVMDANYRAAQAEEASDDPSQWTVHQRAENLNGEVQDIIDESPQEVEAGSRWRVVNALRRGVNMIRRRNQVVETGDPLLQRAVFVSKETGHPTRYGSTNAAEHHAEAAASELVGAIPFDEAHDGGGVGSPLPGFAQGYHVASRDRKVLADRWGSDLDHEGVVFTGVDGAPVRRPDWEHWYGRPQDDEAIARLMNEARRTSVPDDAELVHIVTGRRI